MNGGGGQGNGLVTFREMGGGLRMKPAERSAEAAERERQAPAGTGGTLRSSSSKSTSLDPGTFLLHETSISIHSIAESFATCTRVLICDWKSPPSRNLNLRRWFLSTYTGEIRVDCESLVQRVFKIPAVWRLHASLSLSLLIFESRSMDVAGSSVKWTGFTVVAMS